MITDSAGVGDLLGQVDPKVNAAGAKPDMTEPVRQNSEEVLT